MTDSPRKSPPKGLDKRGRKFWRDVVSAYSLRPDELVLLETAAKCLDLIAELEGGMVGQPLTVKGSRDQEREHPILSEMRQQRALLNRTLAQLKLPDQNVGVKVNQNRDAGMSRWASAHGGWQYGK